MKKDIKNFDKLDDLYNTIRRLRAPDGCEWDNKQTSESLIPYLLEEVHEVIQAIEKNNPSELKEELGDLLLHIIFQVQLAEEKSHFDLNEVINVINDKLIQRHEHIFNENYTLPIDKWELRKNKSSNKNLNGVPDTLPALTRSYRIQEKASQLGFDWYDIELIFSKLIKKTDEFKKVMNKNDPNLINEQFGDILFTLVSLSRFLEIDPESALRKSTKKFQKQFVNVESIIKNKGKTLKNITSEEIKMIWKAVKNK